VLTQSGYCREVEHLKKARQHSLGVALSHLASACCVTWALLKPRYWETARHSFRNEGAEVLFACAFVEQSVTYERYQVMEFVWCEHTRVRQQRIDSAQYRLYWAESIRQIVVDTSESGMVTSGRPENI
jgi:hypothetical protein